MEMPIGAIAQLGRAGYALAFWSVARWCDRCRGMTRDSLRVRCPRGTKKFRERVKAPAPQIGDRSTTAMGDWYATVLFWKPQVALLVNESTLLPVLMPFVPSSTVLDRFPVALKAALASHEVSREFIAFEIDAMTEHRLTSTSNRSVIGMPNQFSFLPTSGGGGQSAASISWRCRCASLGPPAGRCTSGT